MRGEMVLLCLGLMAAASPAFAYIDPGTGSLMVQLLVGAVVSAGVTAALWWRNIVHFFSRVRRGNASVPRQDNDQR